MRRGKVKLCLNLLFAIAVVLVTLSCSGLQEEEKSVTIEVLPEALQPTGWNTRTMWESDAPVWSVYTADILPGKAGTEIVAMDENGRATLLFMNNDQPLPWHILMDGMWLGAAAFGDADPGVPGKELYLAGSRGNLYQVVPLKQGGFESRVIWYARDEIHCLILGEVVPANPGLDLLACTVGGEICLLTPRRAGGAWSVELLYREPARVRDAVVFDFHPELEGDEILYVSRSGRLVMVRWNGTSLETNAVYSDSQGLARIALGPVLESGMPVVYTAGDDGRILRFTKSPSGGWSGEPIFEGEAGARGVAPVRISGDGSEECLAIFGYSKEVVLLRRKKGELCFSSEIIFRDSDKGHWLEAAALDSRSKSDEILISGYSGKVTLLSFDEAAASSSGP